MSATEWRLGEAPGHATGPRLGIETLDRVLGDLHHENLLFALEPGLDPATTQTVLSSASQEVELVGIDRPDSAVDAARDSLLRGGVTAFVGGADIVPDELHALSSIVVLVGPEHMQLQKADGRSGSILGAAFTYSLDDDGMVVRRLSTAVMFGRGLRAVRLSRGWKQADIARMAGVSVSAISQVERGRQSLSFETVVDLAGQLGLTVDALLHGRPAEYSIVRPSRHQATPAAIHPTLRIEMTPIDVPVRGSAAPARSGQDGGMLHVVSGPVVVTIGSERTVLREGETLIAPRGFVQDVRCLGPRPARVIWTAPYS